MKEANFCPNCGSKNSIVVIDKEKFIEIKGVPIAVSYKVKHCNNCGIDFKSLSETFDVVNQARQQYRIMFNIPSPEEIREFMDKYNFSLRDMEKLTGIAFKTIDRYLKGAIPDPSNIKFFKLLLNNPETVLFLMNDDPHFKAPKFKTTREILEKEIKDKHREDCPICKIEIKTSIQSWIVSTIYQNFKEQTNSLESLQTVNFVAKQLFTQKKWKSLNSLNLVSPHSQQEEIGYKNYYTKSQIEVDEQEEKEDQYSYAG